MAADRAELEALIRKADAAGDGDSVRVLFAEMDKLGAQKPTAPVAKPPSLGSFRDPYAYFKPEVQRAVGNTGAGLQPVTGTGEAALQFGTGLGASAAAGLAGIGQGAWNIAAPKRFEGMPAADRVAQVQQAGTYQPRTFAGQNASQAVSDAFDPEVGTSKLNPLTYPGRIGTALGDVNAEIGGPAWLSAGLRTAPEVAVPWAVGKGVSALKASQATKAGKAPSPVPNTGELKVAKDAAYKAADDAGVVIKPESTQQAINIFKKVADQENLGKLPPDLAEAVQILTERLNQGKPLSLKDADKVRQKINDASKSQNATDRRLASVVKNEYDAYLDNLKANDVLAGNSDEGLAILKQARELHGRLKRSEMLDEMESLASLKAESNYTQAGHEHALRKQFEGLTSRAIKGDEYLTPEQLAAVRRVAAPGAAANTLRNISKVDPARGGMAMGLNTLIGGGVGGALGSALGPVGAGAGAIAGQAALGVGANLASRAALRGTLGRVGSAREALVGRGLNASAGSQAKAPTTPLTVAPQAPASSSAFRSPANIRSDMGKLLQRASNIPANIARDSPQVKALWQEMERLQAELTLAESSAANAP